MTDNLQYDLSKILILDFGSQFTQLIARKIREQKVYCEIHPFHYDLEKIKEFAPNGIILSGGPCSVYDSGAPTISPDVLNLGVPILGICYGMQLISHLLGGKVISAKKREYGRTNIKILSNQCLFNGFNTEQEEVVWMSHGDHVEEIPPKFKVIASSDNTGVCAIANQENSIYALQFHPEVIHTKNGVEILKNFIFNIANCRPDWQMPSLIEQQTIAIKNKVGGERVILGLSGGVDSTVSAVLIHRAIGKQLTCIFVDNGLLRKNEADEVRQMFQDSFHIPIVYVDASKRFLDKLKGVVDPEQKRKIIGHEFVQVFEEEAKKIENVKFLAQGTLYPDVIESVPIWGTSQVIKSHHNVGGLPKKMNLQLLEPFRELFKDEVRSIGKELGISDNVIYRQPFPGPGLAIRIIGEITPERLEVLREADIIVQQEIKANHLERKVWQAFAVLLPLKSVGVQGDGRSYGYSCAIRVVDSNDSMTADWSKLPYEVLENISSRITNEVQAINRVVYDISSKPPATIEWE